MKQKQELNIYLNQINLGEKAIIEKILLSGSIKRRLQDLGIVENTKVQCVLKSPFNDPTAYLVRGSVIALRTDITRGIVIKKEG